jgi:hypothetical protein
VQSIEIDEAVLDDGVRSANGFLAWRTQRKPDGLTPASSTDKKGAIDEIVEPAVKVVFS